MGLTIGESWAQIRPSYSILKSLKTDESEGLETDESEGLETDESITQYSGIGIDAGAGVNIGKGVSAGLQLGGGYSNSEIGSMYSVDPMCYVRLRPGIMKTENEITDFGLGYWKTYVNNGKGSFSGVQIRLSEGFVFGEETSNTRIMLSAGCNLKLPTGEAGTIPDSVRYDGVEFVGYIGFGILFSSKKPQ